MLDDVLFSSEMGRYFSNLPSEVQAKLIEKENSINSSNDLYVYAENLLRNKFE